MLQLYSVTLHYICVFHVCFAFVHLKENEKISSATSDLQSYVISMFSKSKQTNIDRSGHLKVNLSRNVSSKKASCLVKVAVFNHSDHEGDRLFVFSVAMSL